MTHTRTRHDGSLDALADIEAEERVVGAVLVGGGEWLRRLRGHGVSAEVFYSERHRLVWRACEALVERGAVVDSVTVVDELRRDGELDAAGGQSAVLTLSLNASAMTSSPAHAESCSSRHDAAPPTRQGGASWSPRRTASNPKPSTRRSKASNSSPLEHNEARGQRSSTSMSRRLLASPPTPVVVGR